jgi:hypothetical protein
MKQLGINTVKRSGPGVYDRNILAVAAQLNMKIHYNFGLPGITDILADRSKLNRLADEITATVDQLKGDSNIVAWNIGDTLWQQLGEQFYKPTAIYQQYAYTAWLRELLIKIRAIDPVRPVTMDVKVNKHLADVIHQLQDQLPEVDAFGLIINHDTSGMGQISGLKVPCFISQVAMEQYAAMPDQHMNIFINAWQDIGDRDYLTFDGIVDHWGRYKPAWYQLGRRWAKMTAAPLLPRVKILRPSELTKANSNLTYHAILYQHHQWVMAASVPRHDIRFEWHLVRTDQWGNPVQMKHAGYGTELELSIPEDPSTYRLYLVASKGNDVVTALSVLNIPL